MNSHIDVFTHIYESKHWGDNGNVEYNGSSGSGSDVEYNKQTYIPLLKDFIKKMDVMSVCDLGCGDFRCGKLIYDDLNVKYDGYDAYEKVIIYNNKYNADDKCYNFDLNNAKTLYSKYDFHFLDFCKYKEKIKKSDLYILKDVIQHWSLQYIYDFLDYVYTNKMCKYIIICNCCNQTVDNPEIPTGSCRGLSANFFPLKRYSAKIIYKYDTKEVSYIQVY